MKPYLFLVAAVLSAPALAGTQTAVPSCYDADNQSQLNQCAADEFDAADAELNRTWKAIQSKYADNPLFLAKLKIAQQRWLAFRDAELEAQLPVGPHQDPAIQYGSVYPMCDNQALAELTRQRVAQLKVWLKGTQEGDICAGSIKNPSELK